MMGLLSIVALSVLLMWITSHLWTFRCNYHAARATDLPMVACLYDPDSVSIALKRQLLRHLVLIDSAFVHRLFS
jgi:hypothetical protein